jgi:Glycosyl hydrolases family 2, TIM barrel domain/Glycosyl hydrolases family 2/Glycosyl hydrolases family 2, sugar binding domain
MVVVTCAGPGRALADASPPAPVPLAGGWSFRLDPSDAGLHQRWWRGSPSSGWQSVSVPHVFDARPLDELFHGTVGWYRLTFAGPSEPSGFGWALRFEQARRVAHAWLNGRSIGGSRDPYTQFVLAARGLRPNAPNTLLVRVDNRKGTEPREGWWNWGGLTRPVTLVPLGPVSLSNPALLPQLSCLTPATCTGTLLFDGWMTDNTRHRATARIEVSLKAPAGGHVQLATGPTTTLARHSSRHVRFSIPLRAPIATWSPDNPQLYDATVRTVAGTQTTQLATQRVGMRAIEVRGGLLYLNGAQITLRGASIQEDVPGRGPAITDADAAQIVSQLQALHANATRAQYPLNQGLLNRLDAAGIMVWSQAPIYHRDELLQTAAQRASAIGTLRGSVLATRAHASVITESVANELSPTPDIVPGTRRYMEAAAHIVHALDPGVPASIDLLSYPGYPAQRTYRDFDLLGINNYFGWYTGKPGHSTASMTDLGPYLNEAHARYPDQALVMTEFGAEANTSGPAALKQTYAFQSQYIQQTLGVVDRLAFMSGSIYWTLREFAVKPHWDGGAHRRDIPRTAIHHKGLLAYDGSAKPAFAVTAGLFAQEPRFHPGLAPGPGLHPPWLHARDLLWLLLMLPLALLALVGLRLRARQTAGRRDALEVNARASARSAAESGADAGS